MAPRPPLSAATHRPEPRRGRHSLKTLTTLFRDWRPDVVMGYTPKPAIYASLAAQDARVGHIVPMLTGLGYAFLPGGGLKRRVVREASKRLYRHAFKGCHGIVFHNADDYAVMRKAGCLPSSLPVTIVDGSGVDLQVFGRQPLPPIGDGLTFLMISRLLRNKGVLEYCTAAAELKERAPTAQWILIGPEEGGPAGLKTSELPGLGDAVSYAGPVDDVRPYLAECHVYVLPSYGEGMPRHRAGGTRHRAPGDHDQRPRLPGNRHRGRQRPAGRGRRRRQPDRRHADLPEASRPDRSDGPAEPEAGGGALRRAPDQCRHAGRAGSIALADPFGLRQAREAKPRTGPCAHYPCRSSRRVASPRPWPYFGDDEIEAVAEVLRSGRVNQWTGDRVKRFENAMAERFAMPHAVAVANGSVGLELALRALGIGPGRRGRGHIAQLHRLGKQRLAGRRHPPSFADVDRNSQNLTAATVEPLLTDRTRAIIPVHLAGWPADMAAIMALAEASDLAVIEDCAQSVGATLDGRPAGSFGDAASFSFLPGQDHDHGRRRRHGAVPPTRPIGSAPWEYKDHGKSWDAVRQPADGPGFRWVHGSIGTNWRLTEMQAAIGLVQLAKLDRWLARRRENVAVWSEALGGSPAVRIPVPPESIGHANYKFYAFLRPEALAPGTTRDEVLAALAEAGMRTLQRQLSGDPAEAAFADLAPGPDARGPRARRDQPDVRGASDTERGPPWRRGGEGARHHRPLRAVRPATDRNGHTISQARDWLVMIA